MGNHPTENQSLVKTSENVVFHRYLKISELSSPQVQKDSVSGNT